MKIDILTLFPEMFISFINTSIIKRAIDRKIVAINAINIRDFSKDKSKKVDDHSIGGGAGLIIKLEPILDAISSVRTPESKVYLLSPKGRVYQQKMARELSECTHLILICGHYEGVDERLLNFIDGQISIGDYILTGGELGAMIIADSIIRLIDGAISKESTSDESFEKYGFLEYPQYTYPREFQGLKIPDILFSGNHSEISKWRLKQSIITTLKNRPELFDINKLTKADLKVYEELENDTEEKQAIIKASKFMK